MEKFVSYKWFGGKVSGTRDWELETFMGAVPFMGTTSFDSGFETIQIDFPVSMLIHVKLEFGCLVFVFKDKLQFLYAETENSRTTVRSMMVFNKITVPVVRDIKGLEKELSSLGIQFVGRIKDG